MNNRFIALSIVAGILFAHSAYSQDGANKKYTAKSKPVHTEQSASKEFSALGTWRGVFSVRPDLHVPFNFEINEKAGKQQLFFLNADEHFEGGNVVQKQDSLFIRLDEFDNKLAFKIEGDSLVGSLRKQNNTGKPVRVVAKRGQNYRFKPSGKPAAADYSGTYDILFKSANGKEEKAVGVFTQHGNKLTGTFLRVTGDSRYLEGSVEGNEFQLSSFIGSSPAYYKGSFEKDGTLTGQNLNAHGSVPFSGNKNAAAALPDPYKLTYLKDGYKTLDFSFPDVNGKKISLKDDKYKNKVVILTITGSWCPNCADEAAFIAPWYKKNRDRGVEVIAIHYERQADSAYVRKVLGRFRERFGIEYDQVIAGTTAKNEVANSLPALKSFISFPTTIIIDKQGNVAQIHTGFNGPATGKYYDEFKKEFNSEIDSLLSK